MDFQELLQAQIFGAEVQCTLSNADFIHTPTTIHNTRVDKAYPARFMNKHAS